MKKLIKMESLTKFRNGIAVFYNNNKGLMHVLLFCLTLLMATTIFSNKLAKAVGNMGKQQNVESSLKPTKVVFESDEVDKIKIVIKESNKTIVLHRRRWDDIQYIQDHHGLAVEHMKKHGIPASIKLAQGIVETNGGRSKLCKKHNNHFGLKCWTKNCGPVFHDDDPDDTFHDFKTVEDCYEFHSKFLHGRRYKHLHKLNKHDYKNWAHGLKAAGYATAKNYAYSLIGVIERYELWKFDELGM